MGMGPRGVSLWLAAALASVALAAAGNYDPCVDDQTAVKGKGFTVGVAFVPNFSLEEWAGVHPCQFPDSETLRSRGALTTVFRTEMDTMATLRSAPQAWANAFAGAEVTAVLYVGNVTARRSAARVVQTADGTVNSLTGVARYSAGKLDYLQWDDTGCGPCGGPKSPLCAQVSDDGVSRSCMTGAAECAAAEAGGSPLDSCSPAMRLAFAGSDKHDQVLESGQQILALSKLSVTELVKNYDLPDIPDVPYADTVAGYFGGSGNEGNVSAGDS